MVDSYDVMWISEECSDADEESGSGSNESLEMVTTITNGSTSYIIEGLQEAASYNITVTAFNAVSNASSSSVYQTNEAGESK